jgi:hypothetical protein
MMGDKLGLEVEARVARWYIFKAKIQNLGKFWRVLQ